MAISGVYLPQHAVGYALLDSSVTLGHPPLPSIPVVVMQGFTVLLALLLQGKEFQSQQGTIQSELL